MKRSIKLEHYGLATILCGVGLAAALPIDAPSSCLVLAVTLSTLFGGLGPGLYSIALSSLGFSYFFLRRSSPVSTEPATYLRLAVFLVTAFLITGLMELKRRVEQSRNRAEDSLRQANSDLARVSRVTTIGELTAAVAHEVKQPIAASITNARTCLRWLAGDMPNIEEARAAARRIIEDQTRAAEIIDRIRVLFKKGTPQRELVDVNELIREMIVLLRTDATRYSISVRTELADVPQVMVDRVQLQQVLMNLMINGMDAMKDVDGTRELLICSQQREDGQVMVSVCDSGVGLPPQQTDKIFDAFFTTKPNGTGMGLRICRSIVESHGGSLWAADNLSRGATLHLTLPTKADAHQQY